MMKLRRKKLPSVWRVNCCRQFPKPREVASKLFNEAGSLDTEESSEKGTKMLSDAVSEALG